MKPFEEHRIKWICFILLFSNFPMVIAFTILYFKSGCKSVNEVFWCFYLYLEWKGFQNEVQEGSIKIKNSY